MVQKFSPLFTFQTWRFIKGYYSRLTNDIAWIESFQDIWKTFIVEAKVYFFLYYLDWKWCTISDSVFVAEFKDLKHGIAICSNDIGNQTKHDILHTSNNRSMFQTVQF